MKGTKNIDHMMILLGRIRLREIYTRVLILVGVLLIGCNTSDVNDKEYQLQHYDDFIINAAVNCVDCGLDFYLSRHPNDLAYIKNQIILPRKTIIIDSLSLKLVLHEWVGTGGGQLNRIIYVSNNADFEYAFPFTDENYYSELKQEGHTDYIDRIKKKTTLQTHLNYLIGRLSQNKLADKNFVNNMVTLVCDSLLDMRELNTSDTLLFRTEIEKELKTGYPFDVVCQEKLESNIDGMLSSAGRPNVRYFSTSKGEYAFWKVETFNVKTGIIVRIEINNLECFTLISM
jgi:hypothetical protein